MKFKRKRGTLKNGRKKNARIMDTLSKSTRKEWMNPEEKAATISNDVLFDYNSGIYGTVGH